MQIGEAALRRCRGISTSSWSDAIDALGVGAIAHGLSWRVGSERSAGRALTVLEEVAPLGAFAQEDMNLGGVLRTGTPGDALVVAMGGEAVSTFGGLAARAASSQGFSLVVIDGACRDIDELRSSGLAVVSRHVTPMSGKGRVRIAQTNMTIRCGGVSVAPGDLVVADETGVVFVPADGVSLVLRRAEEIAAKDRRFEAALDTGDSFEEAANRLRHM